MKKIEIDCCQDCPFVHIETYEPALCNIMPPKKINEKDYMSIELTHKLHEKIHENCPLIAENIEVMLTNKALEDNTAEGCLYRKNQIESEKTFEQQALKDYMSFISEDLWCAGWLMDLEYILWGLLKNPDMAKDYYYHTFDKTYVEKLKWHMNKANCWFHWNDIIHKAVPIDIPAFEVLFSKWEAQQKIDRANWKEDQERIIKEKEEQKKNIQIFVDGTKVGEVKSFTVQDDPMSSENVQQLKVIGNIKVNK